MTTFAFQFTGGKSSRENPEHPPPYEARQDHFKPQQVGHTNQNLKKTRPFQDPTRRNTPNTHLHLNEDKTVLMPKKENAPTNAHPHMQGNTTIARPKKAHAPTNTHLHMKADKTLSRPRKQTHQPTPTSTSRKDKTTSSTKTADTSTHTRHLRMNGDKTLSRPKKADYTNQHQGGHV